MLLATVSQAPYCRGGVRQATGDRTATLLLGIVMLLNDLRNSWSDYARSGAYHEVAHVVVAAVQGIPLTDKGIHLDKWGNGITYYRDRKPDGSANVGSETEREKTIIATFAGWIAQNSFAQSRDCPCPQSGAFYDINQANALLSEMYAEGSPGWWGARGTLYRESERLVERHWTAIESVALALWLKTEISRMPEMGD